MKTAIVAAVIAFSSAAAGDVLSSGAVATVGGANALSPPAARHLVRTASGAYLLALQRDKAGTHPGLVLYRSADDGRTWSLTATLDGSPADRQTADLIAVGDDVALVRSFDAPSIAPDPALDPGRNVWFRWWRSDGQGGYVADTPVLVFAAQPGTAYHRAELAIDSTGRIWVQAFRRGASSCDPASDARCAVCFETANGDNYANDVVVAASDDGGKTFSPPQTLAQTLCRAGGRILSLGSQVILFWNDYSANQNGTVVETRFLLHDDAEEAAEWSAAQDAFPDEPADGIYHGAAMSAVADGEGGLHLAYKDQNDLRLWYRHFDGAQFGPRTQVDDSAGDWALQPATALAGSKLYILDNHVTASGYETRMWRLDRGLGADAAAVLESEDEFYGYPSLPESVPDGAVLPYLHSRTPAPDQPGAEIALRISTAPPSVSLSLATPAVQSDGTASSVVLSLRGHDGFNGTVPLSVSGAPAGSVVTLAEPALTVTGDGEARTALALAPGTAPDGSYGLTITAGAAAAGLTWSIARTPPAATLEGSEVIVPAGGSAHLMLQAQPLPWFGGLIALGFAGLPAGLHGEPAAVKPGGSATLTLSADPGLADASGDFALALTAAPAVTQVPLRFAIAAAPQVTLAGPAAGAVVGATVSLDASATVSAHTSLARVELLVDGEPAASSAASPAHFSWDTTTVAAGEHALAARVTDAAGGSATSQALPVVVRNEAPEVAAAPRKGCSSSGAGPLAGLAALLVLCAFRKR